ncbi:MAG TPA: type 4a pilus biogenesis protein PilO [Gaiellaceae bacterium]|nr:type 4a pilus biogenesis protein PilO [Gaiellaceae bacterium]
MNKELHLTKDVKIVLAVVAATLVAIVAGWFVLIAPKRSDVKDLQRQIDDTYAQIALAKNVRQPSAPPPIRVADLFKLSRAMPNTADIPGVMLQLSRVAQDTGVKFESITPHDPVQYDGYQQVAVDLAFEGRFYDLSDFLYRLRNLVGVHEGVLNATGRLFSVDSIVFNQGQATFPQVKATLTVSAFVFGTGVPAPVPSATAPAGSVVPSAPATENSQPVPAAPYGSTAVGA